MIEYSELRKRVAFKVSQPSKVESLVGEGLVIHTTFEGEDFRVGDMVGLTDCSGDELIGMLVLIIDQGVCLISDEYWKQLNGIAYREFTWRQLTPTDKTFELTLTK